MLFEPTEEEDLGLDLSVYTGDFDEIETTVAQKVFELRDSGDDDLYLITSVIGGSKPDSGIDTMSLEGGGRSGDGQTPLLRTEGWRTTLRAGGSSPN